MFAPQLYIVRSYPLREIVQWNFEIGLSEADERRYYIKQQDNPLFRQIRKITADCRTFNRYVVFIDSSGSSKSRDDIQHLIFDGILIRGRKFVFSERSASMTRNGIFSMVDASIAEDLNQRITMEIDFDKTVLSKYYAYRGLMFSSCHCLDGWKPKMIIVPDRMITIPNQRIKYLYDSEVTSTDKDGNQRHWKQKDIAECVRSIEINAFDGCGIHHPDLSKEMTAMLGAKYSVTSVLLRAPYLKGLSHSVDYESFFTERGVDFIQDIWGKWHSIHDKMFILTESMYKGYKYFKKYGDSRDWDRYWDLFDKYEHCIGIAKWNFAFEEEPVFTRTNYQILQDLELPYDEFRTLADDSIEWADRIVDGDPLYTYCFLGLTADRCMPINGYAKAVVMNPAMLNEHSVQDYLKKSINKYLDDMKCGKLWMQSCFKLLAPDLIMLMEHIGGLPLKGSLEATEFYSRDLEHIFSGEHLIERNPHICRSEHAVLTAVDNEEIDKYVSHLSNVCMVNCKSLIAQRLNGADADGDLVLVLQNSTMLKGVNRDIPIVIDVEDKATAISEEDTKEGRLEMVMRTMKSLIGEYSNYSSAYHNKCPRTLEQKQKYEKYVDQISVLTGKAIDMAKTGIFYKMPSYIAKFGRPLPYFMRYRKPFYARMKLSRAPSNMNRLCFDIERWHKKLKWQKRMDNFDYTIMIDSTIPENADACAAIEAIYLDYCKTIQYLTTEQKRIRQYKDEDIRNQISKFDAVNFTFNWDTYYEDYKRRCLEACPVQKELANIVVRLCYEKYPYRQQRFIWIVAEEGILANIAQVENLELPQRDPFGDLYYLGRRYSMKVVDMDSEEIFDEMNYERLIGDW